MFMPTPGFTENQGDAINEFTPSADTPPTPQAPTWHKYVEDESKYEEEVENNAGDQEVQLLDLDYQV